MILVGITDCPTCKICKSHLLDIKYIELLKKQTGKSSKEILEIKKVLAKLNSPGNFPVILSDDLTKIVLTDELLDNLQKQKLENMLEK